MGAVAVVSGCRGGGGVFALGFLHPGQLPMSSLLLFGTLFHFGCRLRRVCCLSMLRCFYSVFSLSGVGSRQLQPAVYAVDHVPGELAYCIHDYSASGSSQL